MKYMIFDLDDTLYDRRIPFEKACRQCFDLPADTDYAWLHTRFLKHGNDVFEASMTGEMSMEEMYIYRIREAIREARLKNVKDDNRNNNRNIVSEGNSSSWAESENCIHDEEALIFQRQYVWNQNHIELDPGIRPFLDACKAQGYFLGIITNGKSQHQRDKFHALGLSQWFQTEHFLASGDVNINKPDPEIFRIAEKEWKLDLSDTWYVGDSYTHDIVGAREAGWHTIWIDKKRQSAASEPGRYISDKIVFSTSQLGDGGRF